MDLASTSESKRIHWLPDLTYLSRNGVKWLTTAMDRHDGVIARQNWEAEYYFNTFHFNSHNWRSQGGVFTTPHFIFVRDESINLLLFNWASPLASSAALGKTLIHWLDPAGKQSSSSQELLTLFGSIHIPKSPTCASLGTSVCRRLVLTWINWLGGKDKLHTMKEKGKRKVISIVGLFKQQRS